MQARHETMCEIREEEASNLIDEFGIPESKSEVNDILKKCDYSINNCLLTYASMLCEKTPQGNEHVDTLIAAIMQNCKPEHIKRIAHDFGTYRKTINDKTEALYDPNHKGINWKTFAGSKVTYEPVPINLERRKRVLTKIFEGMVRNPNIDIIDDLFFIIGSNKNVTQEFSEMQFKVLKEALSKGECAFTIEELIAASKDYNYNKMQQELTGKILPSEAVKYALERTATGKVDEAREEAKKGKENNGNDKGVTKND